MQTTEQTAKKQQAVPLEDTQGEQQNEKNNELSEISKRIEMLEALVGSFEKTKQTIGKEDSEKLLWYSENFDSLPDTTEEQKAAECSGCATEVMKRDLFEIKQSFPFETADDISRIANREDYFKYRFGQDLFGNPFWKNTATDAYFLAMRDNRPKGYQSDKSHLIAPKGSGGSALIDVPSDVAAIYKRLMPKISDTEMVKHYTSSKKK